MWEKCICGGRNVLARGFGYHNASSRGLGACFPCAGGGRPLFWPGPRGGRLRPERGRPTKMGVIRGSRAQSLRPIEPNTVQLGVNARGERSRLRPERGVSTRMGVKHARQEVSITPKSANTRRPGRNPRQSGAAITPNRAQYRPIGRKCARRERSITPRTWQSDQIGRKCALREGQITPRTWQSDQIGRKCARRERSITPRTWQSDQIGRKRAHGLARMGGIHRWHARLGAHGWTFPSQPLCEVVIIRMSGCITSYNGLRGPTPTHTGK